MNLPSNNSWLGIAVILGLLIVALTIMLTFNYASGYAPDKDIMTTLVAAITVGAGLALQKLLSSKEQ